MAYTQGKHTLIYLVYLLKRLSCIQEIKCTYSEGRTRVWWISSGEQLCLQKKALHWILSPRERSPWKGWGAQINPCSRTGSHKSS